MKTDPDLIHQSVREHYAEAIKKSASCCNSVGSSSAETFLYPAELLATLPEGEAAISYGCGDPVTLAALEPAQTVLDLGSGAGLDCFFAARKVGSLGHVIGVDMTPEMIERARGSAARMKLDNVEFRQGFLEKLPVDDSTIDVAISNCVINLAPDKTKVFKEVFRVLKPGAKLAVSDIVTDGPLPANIKSSLSAWAGCIAGALDVKDYRQAMESAGFTDVTITPSYFDEAAIEEAMQDIGVPDGLTDISRETISKTVFSARITARKPTSNPGAPSVPTESADYFASVAGQWDELREGYFSEGMRDSAIARAGLPGNAVVADIGTGTGFVAAGLALHATKVFGFDESEAMLNVARKNLGKFPNVELKQAAGDSLPLPDESLDGVFANMYLHHAPDPQKAISEMARVLKPGGVLCITDLDTHDHVWQREQMADRWLGFEREDMQKWYSSAGLGEIDVDCAEGTCNACGPDGSLKPLSVFVAIGRKKTPL